MEEVNIIKNSFRQISSCPLHPPQTYIWPNKTKREAGNIFSSIHFFMLLSLITL